MSPRFFSEIPAEILSSVLPITSLRFFSENYTIMEGILQEIFEGIPEEIFGEFSQNNPENILKDTSGNSQKEFLKKFQGNSWANSRYQIS